MKRIIPLVLLVVLLAACGGGSKSTPVSTGSGTTTNTQATNSPAPTKSIAASIPASNGNTNGLSASSTPKAPAVTPAMATPKATGTALTSLVVPPNPTLNKIVLNVEQIRKLRLDKPIPDSFLSRDQLRERLAKQFKGDYPKKQAQADSRLFAAFGLVPPGTNLQKLQLDLYSEQVAGFYDPKTNKMYVISSQKKLNALAKVTYAHETNHALQDQNFDLTKLQKQADKKDDDASLATTALIEGDASEVERVYLYTHPDLISDVQKETQAEVGSQQQLNSAPPIIRETLLFPYIQGQQFVDYLVRADNDRWTLVNEAFRNPPTSTEQIMHPQKFLSREKPVAISLPNLSPVLGSAWTKAETNLFGEFQTKVLLHGKLPEEQASQAAAGWGGDEFALWEKGNSNVVIWKTVWDTSGDASQFFSALQIYDQDRFGSKYSTQGSTHTLSANGEVAQIKISGKNVYYVIAPDKQTASKAMGKLSGS